MVPDEKGRELESVVHAIEAVILESSPALREKPFKIETRKRINVSGVHHEIDIFVTVELAKGYASIFEIRERTMLPLIGCAAPSVSSGSKFPAWFEAMARSSMGIFGSKRRASSASAEIPVILCDEWTPAQVKAFRLMVNRSVTWADWDEELLALELQEIQESDFDLSLTGFDPGEIDDLLALDDEEKANATPPLPESPVSRAGDLWLLGPHRVLCW